jgi:hypothetical protein
MKLTPAQPMKRSREAAQLHHTTTAVNEIMDASDDLIQWNDSVIDPDLMDLWLGGPAIIVPVNITPASIAPLNNDESNTEPPPLGTTMMSFMNWCIWYYPGMKILTALIRTKYRNANSDYTRDENQFIKLLFMFIGESINRVRRHEHNEYIWICGNTRYKVSQ